MTDGTHNASLSWLFVAVLPMRNMHKNGRSGNGIVLYVDTICLANGIVMLFSYLTKPKLFSLNMCDIYFSCSIIVDSSRISTCIVLVTQQ